MIQFIHGCTERTRRTDSSDEQGQGKSMSNPLSINATKLENPLRFQRGERSTLLAPLIRRYADNLTSGVTVYRWLITKDLDVLPYSVRSPVQAFTVSLRIWG